MGPLLILKFACASLTGYIYLKRYTRAQGYAVIGGLLYAFSGFRCTISFSTTSMRRSWFSRCCWRRSTSSCTIAAAGFSFCWAMCCFVNYYFFVGQVVFCIIYWFVRISCRSWRFSLRDLAILLLESMLGLLLTSVLLLPTILAVVQNPRVNNPPNGWNALIYGWSQRYFHILQCLFFPPDLPARPNFTPDSGSKWSSLGAWLPLFSMTGVYRLFAEPPPSLAQENARHPLFDGRGADPQFGVPAVQFVLLCALVLYAHADDVPRDRDRAGKSARRLEAGDQMDARFYLGHRASNRPDGPDRRQWRRGDRLHRSGSVSLALLGVCGDRPAQPAAAHLFNEGLPAAPAPAGALQAEGTVLLPAAVQRGADKALCAVLHVRRGGHHGGIFPVFYHARQDAEQRQPHPYDPLFAQRRERPGD